VTAPTRAKAIETLSHRFDAVLKDAGYFAMSGQIIDASIVAAPRRELTDEEKTALKDGKIPRDWRNKPAKLAQKDRDARWTLKAWPQETEADQPGFRDRRAGVWLQKSY
jgi:hypothetical protein